MKNRPDTLRKFCAFVLAITMVLSTVTTNAFAESQNIQGGEFESFYPEDVFISPSGDESEGYPGAPKSEPLDEEPDDGEKYPDDGDYPDDKENEPYEPEDEAGPGDGQEPGGGEHGNGEEPGDGQEPGDGGEKYPDDGDYPDDKENEPYEPDNKAEPSVTFEFYGDLIINMIELYADADIEAILLRGISAVTEDGEDVTHLITVEDDGGFAEYVRENFADITAPGQPGAGIGGGPGLLLPEDEDEEDSLIAETYNTFSGLLYIITNIFNSDDTYESETYAVNDTETLHGEDFDDAFYGEGYAFETQVTYAVVHPQSGQVAYAQSAIVFSSGDEDNENYANEESAPQQGGELVMLSEPRDVRVEFMGIMPLNPAFQTWLQNAVNGGAGSLEIGGHRQVDIQGFSGVRQLTGQIDLPNNRHVVIVSSVGGDAGVIGLAPGNSGRHFVLGSGANLTLNAPAVTGSGGVQIPGTINNVTLRGNDPGTGVGAITHGGGVQVNSGATFTLAGGAIERSGATAATNFSFGGGVHVNGGTFRMSGGELRYNRVSNGGGVHLNGGTFYMTDGHIRHNVLTSAAGQGGGVSVTGGATFNMSGGQVRNTTGPGGRGVWVTNGHFNMSNTAVIRDNNSTGAGGGVVILDTAAGAGSRVQFHMSGNAQIHDNVGAVGGGVFVNPQNTFEMVGGQIWGNRATTGGTDSSAGGVHVSGGRFEMDGGVIRNHVHGTGTQLSQGRGVLVGGGIFTMKSGQIHTNNTTGNGGGVHVASNATFEMDGGSITNNSTPYSPGSTGWGGGVFLAGSGSLFEFESGTIESNRAERGGGVYVLGGTFEMTGPGAIIHNNRAINSHVGGATTAYTGGGAGVHMNSGTFTMEDGRISANIAAPSGGTGGGGGVFLRNNAAFNMSGGVVGGSSWYYANTFAAGNGVGAGVFVHNASFEMSGSAAVTHNDVQAAAQAPRNNGRGGGIAMAGGSIVIRDNARIAYNAGGTSGGGVHMTSGLFTMHDGRIENNYLNAGNYGAGFHIGGGNAIMHTGSIRNHNANRVWVTGAQPGAANQVRSVSSADNHINQRGGGVVVSGSGVFTMNGGEIHGNVVRSVGAGVAVTGGQNARFQMNGGEIHSNTVTGLEVPTMAPAANATPNPRFGVGGGGVAVATDSIAGNGGQLVMQATDPDNPPVIRDNAAPSGGGVFVYSHHDIPARRASFTMHNGEIRGNSIETGDFPIAGGGGVRVQGQGATFTMNGGLITDHDITGNGGGVLVDNPALSLQSGTPPNSVYHNFGNSPIGGTMNMTGGSVRSNTASTGGGIHVSENGNLQIANDSLIHNNAAALGHGGGIFFDSERTLQIHGASGDYPHITGNFAHQSGGGIWTSGDLDIESAVIGGPLAAHRNNADNGGGIWASGAITLEEATIRNNSAGDGNGGGIFRSGTDNFSITGGSITHNVADGNGGGIFMASGVEVPANAAQQTAINNRLTIDADAVFTDNDADGAIDFATLTGVTNFPAINWQGINSHDGVRGALPEDHVDYHLLNNYDIFWQHPFSTVTVTLAVVDGRTPAIGVGSPTVTLTVGSETPIVLTGVDDDYVTIDSPSPGSPVPTTLTVTGLNPAWFAVTAQVQVAGASLPTPVTLQQTGTAPAITWTATPPISITAGGDVTVTVTITANQIVGITGGNVEINYGTHVINSVSNHTIRLGTTPGTITNRDQIVFTVFNGVTAHPAWTLQVQADPHPLALANSQLASRMFLENTGNWVYGQTGSVFTSSGNLFTTFHWDTPGFNGVEVRTVPGTPPLTGSHQAQLTWTFVP